MPTTRGLNIAALSRRTGVAPDTLRKWEQRYGVLRPKRTAGGQRRYDEADVARVEWLRARLGEGWRIGEAAALLGDETPGRTAVELHAALLEAVTGADADAVGRLLDQAFSVGKLEETLAEVVLPVLRDVGDGWASHRFSVAQEHLVTAAIRARLERLLADARGGVRGVAVLACAPGERHELGLLMLAVLLRADGWQVAYLGADTPLDDALDLAQTVKARLLCLSASMPEARAALAEALGNAAVPQGTRLVVGGAAVSRDDAGALGADYVNGDLARAIRGLRKLAA
ncbi:MAG TPA: MerR family transcriptional regulator [Gaiellaceae bacterium]|nr:MerR family transcriptional regulator [Gaiellaceae bacterium]